MLVRNFILLGVTVLLLAACAAVLPMTVIAGSGQWMAETYDFADFDTLVIGDGMQVEITPANGYGVEVRMDGSLADRLLVEQKGRTLLVGLKPFTAAANARLEARVSLPVLVGLQVSGGSRAVVRGFSSGEAMQVAASGGSQVRGDVVTGNLQVTAADGSIVTLSGQGMGLRAEALGGSTVDLRAFAAGDADVVAAGASRVWIDVAGTLDATAGGASGVSYTGSPRLGRIAESGAARVRAE